MIYRHAQNGQAHNHIDYAFHAQASILQNDESGLLKSRIDPGRLFIFRRILHE